MRQLNAGLGRESTTRESILISNVAATTVRAEQIAVQIVTGEHTDDTELVRLTNIVSRLLGQLGKAPQKPLGPSLEAYTAANYPSAPQRSDKRTGGPL